MRRWDALRFLGVGAVLAGSWAGGCNVDSDGVAGVGVTNTIVTNDPKVLLKILEDTTQPEEVRREADRRVVMQKGAGDSSRLASLERLLFTRGQSAAMQIYGIDELVKADPARAGRSLSFYVGSLDDAAVVARACEAMVELKDPRAVDALLKRLAREQIRTKPTETVEGKAIVAISGESMEKTLVRVISDATREAPARLAALNVLKSAVGDEEAVKMAREASITKDDRFLERLQWCAAMWGSLPVTMSEVKWCGVLMEATHAKLVEKARKNHALLKDQTDYVFAVRYVYLLGMLEEEAVKTDRAALLAELSGTLAAKEHVKREAMYLKASDDNTETLGANAGALNRCDLLFMRMLVRALDRNQVTPPPYTLGLADMRDKSTEHGGFMRVRGDGGLELVDVPAQLKNGDFAYMGSEQLMLSTAVALCHYHFHFQDKNNERIAGPGAGDLAYVRMHRCLGVVFTSVMGDRVNVDVYTPGGAVVDLGVYR